MPLPTFDTLDAIPEAFRSEYEQKDGKFVPKTAPDPSAALQAKNAELIGQNKKLSERAKLLGDRPLEEIQADLDLAKTTREKKAKEEGDFESLKKLQADELKKRDDEILKLKSSRENDHRRRVVVEAINAAGGKVKKLQEPISRFVKVAEEDGELVEQVIDAKGKVRMVDGQGTRMTVAQLVEEFKADDDYAVDFAASSANGSGARNDGGASGSGKTVLIPKDASPQEYRRLKADAEKRGVPYAVAS